MASALAVGRLWISQGSMPNAVGRVEATRVNVASAVDGKLLPLNGSSRPFLRPFDRVERGQIVARLDDAELVGELAALRSEAATLQADLVATQAETQLSQFDRRQELLRDAAELAYQIERYRLEVLASQGLADETRLELQEAESQLDLVEKASGSGLTTAGEAATLRSHRELLGKLLATRAAALDQATENLRAAEGRLASFPELPSADVAAAIEPIRNAAAAAQARMDALAAQVEALVIRSPVTGTVAAVYSHPGQGVSAGDWILTIAADEAESITGYVPATHRFRPSEGMRVGVRLRVPGSRMVESVVEQVGSQWETMPLELLADPQIPQLALPVRIELPEGLNVLPGEIVDIRFYGSSTGDPSGQPITHGRYGDASREVASRTRRNEEITAECAENAETNRT